MAQQIQSIPYPSYTTAQRDALTGVSVGFKITNSTIGRNQMWNGTNWIEIDEGELRWRDEYVGGIWIPAAGGAAPDLNNYTIGGIATRMYEFDGGNTEERLSNTFEIPHDIPIALINDLTTHIEVHIHWQPSTNNTGDVEWFFDWCYIPLNAVPIPMTTMSVVCSVDANQQYVHKIKAFENNGVPKLPVPAGGFGIGDIILFNLRRTPTGNNDTYPDNALLIKVAMHVPTDDRGSKDIYDN
jgi:hypothetical protein